MQKRFAVWQKRTTATSRRKRTLRALGLLAIAAIFVWVCIASYRGDWWGSLLDWGVVAIPTIIGFAAWVIPVKQTTSFHRWWLFAGGLAFSGLIGLQQWKTNVTHAKEIAGLATKADIAKLPTVQQILDGIGGGPAPSRTDGELEIKQSLAEVKKQLDAAYKRSLVPCDLNADGKVDQEDVNEAVAETMGTSPRKFDLDHDGTTSVVDVQRVINAVRGYGCRTD